MKTDKYKEAISQIQEMVDANPNLTRKDRHQIICHLTGIEKGMQEVVERYSRALRHVLPKDEVSAQLEKEWKMPNYMRPLDENENWNAMFKSISHPMQ